MVISLNLAPAPRDVTASLVISRGGVVLNRATGLYSGTFTFTNGGSTILKGPFQVELSGLPAGITLANASGSHAGAPYLTLNTATLAPGAKGTVTLNFANPGKLGLSYSYKVFSGSF